MIEAIAKVQPAARASLAVALGLATWTGVAAMLFGLVSWFAAVTGFQFSMWIQHFAS